MKYTPYRVMATDKGTFSALLFHISTDLIHWIWLHSLTITEHGQLFSLDENDNHFLLLHALQLCLIQINPTMGSDKPQKKKLTDSPLDDPPVVYIRTYENEKLYIQVSSKSTFGNLMSTLLVWLSLKPQGLAKKWYGENRHHVDSGKSHEVLVCRFKVYGPIPQKSRNLNIVHGPPAPVYQNRNAETVVTPTDPTSPNGDVHEGWFYTMGVLKSNGKLNFILELDGTLLYSLDVTLMLLLEIREVHNLVFDSSNVLFVGYLKELRFNNLIKTTNNLQMDQYYHPKFLVREGKTVPNNQRIFIEFPLHIDLEDWFVGLNYFSRREYIGLFSPTSVWEGNDDSSNLEPPSMPNSQLMSSFPRLISLRNVNVAAPNVDAKLSEFRRDHFTVSKRLTLDIIEAKFELAPKLGKVYAEVRMWGMPWSRTAAVTHTVNPFWKEEFLTELPILTQMIHIIIKQQLSSQDKVVGTVYVTPDVLLAKPTLLLTIAVGGAQGASIKVQGILAGGMLPGNAFGSVQGDIVRLPIYDALNVPIGKLLINVILKEYHILPPSHFKPLEKMLVNAPMKDLIKYCNNTVSTQDFELVALIILDIFQLLGVEENWFKALMETELINVDKITRKNYTSGNRRLETKKPGLAPPAGTNVFNTLFRGLLIFSKSLEKYNLRIGQEYLEKVFSEFFEKIGNEKLNCEIDPRYVRVQERRERLGLDLFSDEQDSDLDLDDDVDIAEERRRNERVNAMVDENLVNLRRYCEEIWNKIYLTLNDLPDKIKTQLKNFRVKVELACDPDDKTTALNCLLAFIFLRFFCPAILNPKLFYLTKHHQTGATQRTLTLIAKVLLNLANRQQFSQHKEPHLVPMNDFLLAEQSRVFDYFDKLTGRKNDFSKKVLDLLHELKRFDLGLHDDNLSELPTTPYLISKYLRLTELVHLLTFNNSILQLPLLGGSHNDEVLTLASLIATLGGTSHRQSIAEATGELTLQDDVYQIGSLEFEKLEFLDLAGDNETEGFIKLLCRSDDNVFSFIALNITLMDLQKMSTKLMTKVNDLQAYLANGEFPGNFDTVRGPSSMLWETYVDDVLLRCYLDVSRNCVVFLDVGLPVPPQYRRIVDNALMLLKLKFDADRVLMDEGIPNSFSNGLLGSVLKPPSKNPLKKWFRKNQVA